MLQKLPEPRDANLLAGFHRSEDACAYRMPDGRVLLQTVDFFTPVVESPRMFGAIAAANAFSDIYAAGGRPLLALSLAAFPSEVLPLSVLEEILLGSAEKVAEAGALLAGGHTIDHDVPIYGLAATGTVAEEELTRHDAARPGDEVVLTKPVGGGILVAAGRADAQGGAFHQRLLADDLMEEATRSMAALNAAAASKMAVFAIRAATDVSGYGLLGHAFNLAEASRATLSLRLEAIPVLRGARELAARGVAPGGTRKNFRNLRPRTLWQGRWSDEEFLLLADAQTSGGILACVPGGRGEEYARACREAGAPEAAVIGRVEARGSHPLRVEAEG